MSCCGGDIIADRSLENAEAISLAGKNADLLSYGHGQDGGLLCYVLSVLAWIVALTRVDVSIAYPMLSLGYVIVTIAAWFLFNEPISAVKILALSIIIFGIVLLANS